MPNKHEPLTKYWVEVDDLLYQQGDDTMMKNVFEHCDHIPVFKAADVDALLGDPQALAAYLIERKKEAQP